MRISFNPVSPSAYPWGRHLLCLTPCLFMIAGLALFQGTGAELAEHYAQLRVDHPNVTLFLTLVTYCLNPLFYLLFAALFIRALRRKDKALLRFVVVYSLVQLAISFLLVRGLKIVVGKPRPDAMLAGTGYDPFTFRHGNHSFPSGHSTEISASTLPLATRLRGAAPSLALGCVTALTAYSRIYLGMHHLWDIFAGLLLGSFAAFCIHHFCRQRQS